MPRLRAGRHQSSPILERSLRTWRSRRSANGKYLQFAQIPHNAQTRNAMPRSWTRISGRPSQRDRSWYKSARRMVSRRTAVLPFREISMSKSGRRSPRRKRRPTARSSRRASTPPRPLSPKAAKRANSERFALKQIARCITPRSSPACAIPKGMPRSRSAAARKHSPRQRDSAHLPP